MKPSFALYMVQDAQYLTNRNNLKFEGQANKYELDKTGGNRLISPLILKVRWNLILLFAWKLKLSQNKRRQ